MPKTTKPKTKPTDGASETPTLFVTKKPLVELPYKLVPSTEKFFGCCSQRAGCAIIGASQILLGILSACFQVVLAVMARGGIDLTNLFGAFPKDDSIRKFIFGVSVVDIISKIFFVVSGVVIIIGAAKRNAPLVNAWMCISSYTFASSIATNAAAAGGLISFADSREEYALPLTFDTLLMGAQFYVMSIVKGYHKHLEKAEEALKRGNDDDKKAAEDDHDIFHSSTLFKCWKFCMYEEKLQKQRAPKVDHLKAWKEAERERRLSIKGHATEDEQKKLMNRALDAERKYQRLLLQQALREEQNKREQSNKEWFRTTQLPRQPMPWPPPPGPPPGPPLGPPLGPPPGPPPGWRVTNPNVRPVQPGPPPNKWGPGWAFPPPYPTQRPQVPNQPPPPRRPVQIPGPSQPPSSPTQPPTGTTQPPAGQSQRPASPVQPQPKPPIPQDRKKRPTDPNVTPIKSKGRPSSPVLPKSSRLTESTLPSQDQKAKKSTKSKPSTATTTRPTFTLEKIDDPDWQSLTEEPIPSRQSGVTSFSDPDGKPKNSSRTRRFSK